MAFKLPESLDGLTVAELDALIVAARADLSALGISTESSDDDLAAAEALVDAIAAIKTQGETVAAAEAERAERVARLTEASADPEPEAEPEAPAEEPEVPAEDKVLVEAAAEVITPDAVIDPAPTTEKEAVTASTSPVQRAASNALPVDFAPAKARVTLTAAAGVPGATQGQPVEDLDAVVALISAQIKTLPKHNLATKHGGVRQRFSTVSVHRDPGDDELVQGATGNDWDLVERAGNERRLPGGSLVAAAAVPGTGVDGWCAPSETLYDLCAVEDVVGMLDVPEFTVKRGGIRYTKGPKWDDVYTDKERGFHIENTPVANTGADKDVVPMKDKLVLQDADGGTLTKKPCIMVGCYPWYEERLDADGLCVKSPILLETTYPELIKRFTEMVLVAHKHDLNERRIARIRAAAVANGGITALEAFGDAAAPAGRTIFNLAAVEYAMIGLRSKYRMSPTATIEIIAPTWLQAVMRMDLALENGRSNRNVTDAEITAWFTARNARVQWVYDWQELTVGADHLPLFPTDGSPTGGTPAADPKAVELLMYPAGTWSAGVSDIFSIDTVYDAASLEDNVFTAMFMEEAELMVQRCTETIGVTVELCASGRGVAEDLADCLVGKKS